MDLGLDGKRALVTGGTKGIGRSIAEVLAAEGCSVGICARNAAEVDEAVAALRAKGVAASGTAVDVADEPALRSWVEASATALGGVDIVVANVSAFATRDNEASWRAGFSTDVMGTVALVDAAMPHLEASSAGSIVVISSVSGRERPCCMGMLNLWKCRKIRNLPFAASA